MKKRCMYEIQRRIETQTILVEKDHEFANLKETVICLEDQNRNYQEIIERDSKYRSAPQLSRHKPRTLPEVHHMNIDSSEEINAVKGEEISSDKMQHELIESDKENSSEEKIIVIDKQEKRSLLQDIASQTEESKTNSLKSVDKKEKTFEKLVELEQQISKEKSYIMSIFAISTVFILFQSIYGVSCDSEHQYTNLASVIAHMFAAKINF